MEIINFFENNEIEKLIKFSIERKKLIPIIGAGFTRGEYARNGTILGGDELKELMISEICLHSQDITKIDFVNEGYKFSEVADEYFKYVPKEDYKQLLRDKYTNVKLSTLKKNFLKVDWPYIYTLNIDDGIERNSEYTTILPYKTLSKNVASNFKCVYKMHGDVFEEIKYENIPNVIFSNDQYIKSLEGNNSILKLFQSDYISNNIIFIGCSLQDELDLNYAIKTIGDDISKSAKKIFITTSKPTGLRKSRLERFGINLVIVLNDYNSFYEKIYQWYTESTVSNISVFDEYKNIELSVLEKNIENNKDYIVDIVGAKSAENSLPYFHIERTVQAKILETYEKDRFTVVSGKRFSGKTFIAKQLSLAIVDKDTFLFPSTVSLSNSEIMNLSFIKDSVFIFDSSSLSLENAIYLQEIEKNLEKNDSYIIIMSNKNDSQFSSIISRLTIENFHDIDIKFDEKEIINLNNKLSEIGLIESLDYKSIMNNCYRYNKTYDKLIIKSVDDYSDDFILLLILLATDSKVYSVMMNIFGIKRSTVDDFLIEISPFVEFSSSRDIEFHQHSGFKLILNSPVWVFLILGRIYEKKGTEQIVSQVSRIVGGLKGKPEFKSIYGKIIGFDNLNQIFYSRNKGVGKLIFEIYSNLEGHLYKDPHYWLQRAKSTLYLKRKDKVMLSQAIDYAKKSHFDTENIKLKINSTTTIALLYGRLSNEQKFLDSKTLNDAIYWYYDAIQDKGVNRRYIDSIMGRDRDRNDLKTLVKHLMNKGFLNDHNISSELSTKADRLITLVVTNT
jgi:hypothetical protein